MMFFLNHRYNHNNDMIRVPKKKKSSHKTEIDANGKSVKTKDGKKRKKEYIWRPKLYKDLPIEKKVEAIIIVGVGIFVPLIYALCNLMVFLYGKYVSPPVIHYNYTMPYFLLNTKPALTRWNFYHKSSAPDSLESECFTDVDRMSGLSLKQFYDLYDAKWPVVIADCVPKWPAAKLWDSDYFINKYAKQRVSMSAVAGALDKAQSFALPLEAFIKHIDNASPTSWTYIQDEIFLPTQPELLATLGSCNVLEEDFFTLFPEGARPWWAFFLWGTKYSRSHLHMDPYNWTGTNAVLRGRKKWKLYLPGQDHLMYVKHSPVGKFPLKSHKYNSRVDAFDSKSVNAHPLIKKAKCIEFVQNPGELLIIPTGWFHQAFNLEPTMAVAGQLMNRGNYKIVLEELFKGGDVDRRGFRHDIEKLSPAAQVREVIKSLKLEVIESARKVTSSTKEEIEKLDKSRTEL